jgi:hypothetical protein
MEKLKVNIHWQITSLTRSELNEWLAKNPTDDFYIISSSKDDEDFIS